MSTETNNHFQTIDDASGYVEDVRQHYRQGDASYAGRRTEEQQVIADLASEEARIMVDGVMAGILATGNTLADTPTGLPENYEDIEVAGFKWSDFRSEFERLLVGFGVITNRLHREGHAVPDYLELGDADRSKAASVLFGDFLAHNALRFGVDGSGVERGFSRHTEDGGKERVLRDIDKARSDKEVRRNMVERSYSSGVATHQAGKVSPVVYKQLRREFPEIDKTQFDQAVGHYRNVAEALAERGQ